MKLLLKIAFDGSGFHGFQYQPGMRTVQGTLTERFSALYGSPVKITGCSRTDSGVHARGFCVLLDTGASDVAIPVSKLHRAANNILPHDVAVLAAAKVTDDFHPRYSALGKEYRYEIRDRVTPDPFLSKRVLEIGKELSDSAVSRMNEAAGHFVGKHDFSAFMASGSKITDPVRCVTSAEVARDERGLAVFRVAADGFLYNMVRIMTGTLLDVAEGRLSCRDIPGVIERGERSGAGATVPPDGLYLERVFYPDVPSWEAD